MTKAVLAVYSRPSSADREDEYNKWYNETHIPQVCEVPGFTGARRFAISATQMGKAAPDPSLPTYLAIYEIEADDLSAPLAQLGKGVAVGSIQMSDAISMDPPPVTVLYELIEP